MCVGGDAIDVSPSRGGSGEEDTGSTSMNKLEVGRATRNCHLLMKYSDKLFIPLDPKDSTSNMRYFPRISPNSLKIPPNF